MILIIIIIIIPELGVHSYIATMAVFFLLCLCMYVCMYDRVCYTTTTKQNTHYIFNDSTTMKNYSHYYPLFSSLSHRMTIVIRFIKIEIILFNIIDVMTYSINVNIFKLKFIKYFKIAQFLSYIDIVFTTKKVFFCLFNYH